MPPRSKTRLLRKPIPQESSPRNGFDTDAAGDIALLIVAYQQQAIARPAAAEFKQAGEIARRAVAGLDLDRPAAP